MIVPPVSSPVRLWGFSAVILWRGGKLLPFASSVDEKGGNGTPVKRGWEDVVFEPSRNLGEIREVEFLCIFERVHVERVRLIPARRWFLSKDVAPC